MADILKQICEENKLLREQIQILTDQLDHAQRLITTPVKGFAEMAEKVNEQHELIRVLEKELLQTYREKARLNKIILNSMLGKVHHVEY